MRLFFLIFCCVFSILTPTHAEQYIDEDMLDYTSNVPDRIKTNISSLSQYLTKPYTNDYDKAKAIAYYVASHIAYDEYLFNNGKRTKLRRYHNKPQDVLQNKIGVCGDYAKLFTALCQKAGISAYTIHGIVFDVDENMHIIKHRGPANWHAWNYFKYQGRKILVDVTFMSQGKTGYEDYINNFKHRQAVNKLKKEDNIYDITPFYFNFTEEEEVRQKYQKHIAKKML